MYQQFVKWLFAIVIIALSQVAQSAGSDAEKFVPNDFDPGMKYETYSYDELFSLVSETAEISNSFVGKPVKLFAAYDPKLAKLGINRKRRSVFPSFGCEIALCDSLEPLVSPEIGMTFTGRKGLTTSLMLYLPDAQKYSSFLRDTEALCKPDYPCYIWTRGVLQYKKVSIKSAIGSYDGYIAYLDPVEIRLYEGDSMSKKFTIEAAKLAFKLYQFSPRTK